MMPLNDAEMSVVRSWVGDGPTDEDLNEIYFETSSPDAVVLRTLRYKLALYTEEPASLSVPGFSYSNGQNIISLENMIKKFMDGGGTGLVGGVATGSIEGLVIVPMVRNVPR
jgi:hypothetical protein